MMKVILTGATGTAGSAALRRCIADEQVQRVTVLSRRPVDVEHEKVRVILHKDFLDYEGVKSELQDHQACLWCLGISQSAVSKEEYEVITHDYALAAARAMGSVNPSFTFCFLSGHGADSNEKSWILFARVKGKTENELLKLGHPKVYNFRPGYIHPDSPRNRVPNFLASVMHRLAPSRIINASDLGTAMLEAAKHGSDKNPLSNTDIRELANRAKENS